MEYEEYMASLTEQIHDKRAKQLVAKEIKNHIEEQAEMYEGDGMEHAKALKEAVRQMGNPVETGAALNQIHKPKMPWVMLGIIVFLMISSIIMQAVVFAEGQSSKWNLNWGSLLPSTIVYNLAGFAMIMLLLYVDYNFIAKYAYKIYAAYLVGMITWLLVVNMNIWSSPSINTYYGLQMLFPVVFAGIVYRNRNRGCRGIVICLTMALVEFVWHVIGWEWLGDTFYYSYYPALAESILIMLLVLCLAIWKGIFGKERRKPVIFLTAIVLVLAVSGVVFMKNAGGMGTYILRRFRNIFVKEDSAYLNLLLQEGIARADWFGGGVLVGNEPESLNYSTLLLNGVFTYFGKVAGVAVIAAFIVFIGLALKMSLKQSNRIGFLLGTVCTMSILVRFVAYVAINLGCAMWWTTLVPFFSYGKVGAMMNGIYIGLILCVYRNSRILHEEYIAQKRLPRIRVTIE